MLWSLVSFVMATASMIPFFGPPMPPTLAPQSFGCTDPHVRKEWRTLSKYERSEWIRGMKCLVKLPHNPSVIATQFLPSNPPLNTSSSYYDDIVYTHMDLGQVVHGTGFFNPWHRTYVHTVETAMKKYCGYVGATPYWSWTKDAADVYNSPIFTDSDPKSGLGGWGDPNTDARVLDGGFSHTSGFALSYPYPHTLRRNFTLRGFLEYSEDDAKEWHVIRDQLNNVSFTTDTMEKVINGYIGDYRGFQRDLEWLQAAHISVHSIVGGDMSGLCTADAPSSCNSNRLFAPNDPMFFLHHAMMDKIWYDWQLKHPENVHAFSGGSKAPSGVAEYRAYPVGLPPDLSRGDYLPSNGLFFDDVTIGDVISTTGGYLCYTYE